MPNLALKQAIKEAYASAPIDAIILHTLELRHPAFNHPIRVVRNYADEDRWLDIGGEEVKALLDAMEDDERRMVGLVARLEANAPIEASKMVSFIALGFNLDLPPIDSIPVPEITVTMDNVGREITDALDLAATSQDKIEITYRPYLSTDIEGPQMEPPITLIITEVEATPLTVTARARMLDIGNKAFPSLTYDPETFPGLIR